jgi:hypothetical protein
MHHNNHDLYFTRSDPQRNSPRPGPGWAIGTLRQELAAIWSSLADPGHDPEVSYRRARRRHIPFANAQNWRAQ